MDNSTPISKTALLKIISEVREPQVDPEIEEEKDLENLASKNEWKTLKKIVEEEIDRLNNLNVIGENDDVATVGYRYIATQLAKEKLRWVIDTVESTYRIRVEQSST